MGSVKTFCKDMFNSQLFLLISCVFIFQKNTLIESTAMLKYEKPRLGLAVSVMEI